MKSVFEGGGFLYMPSYLKQYKLNINIKHTQLLYLTAYKTPQFQQSKSRKKKVLILNMMKLI